MSGARSPAKLVAPYLCRLRQPLCYSNQSCVAATVPKNSHCCWPSTLPYLPKRHHHCWHTSQCRQRGKGVAAVQPGLKDLRGRVYARWWCRHARHHHDHVMFDSSVQQVLHTAAHGTVNTSRQTATLSDNCKCCIAHMPQLVYATKGLAAASCLPAVALPEQARPIPQAAQPASQHSIMRFDARLHLTYFNIQFPLHSTDCSPDFCTCPHPYLHLLQ
jgi:hypothetical protein